MYWRARYKRTYYYAKCVAVTKIPIASSDKNIISKKY